MPPLRWQVLAREGYNNTRSSAALNTASESVMTEPQTIGGIWFLPSAPEKTISGTLHYDPGASLRLELNGQLIAHERSANGPTTAPLVLGFSALDMKITLLDCQLVQAQWAGLRDENVGSQSVLRPGTAILGTYFERLDEVAFTSMRLSFTHLHQWLGISGFSKERIEDGTLIYRFDLPAPIELYRCEDFRLEAHFSYEGFSYVPTHIALVQQSRLTVTFAKKMQCPKPRELVRDIQNFLTFALACPVYIETISAFTPRAVTSGRGGNVQLATEFTVLEPHHPSHGLEVVYRTLTTCFSTLKLYKRSRKKFSQLTGRTRMFWLLCMTCISKPPHSRALREQPLSRNSASTRNLFTAARVRAKKWRLRCTPRESLG
jgi:hypothetical protein